MAVNRCIIHSWSSPDVIDGSDIHPWWAHSSTRPLLQINLSSDDALLANAATVGDEYAAGVEARLLKVDDATNAGAVGKQRDEYSIYVHGWANRDVMRAMTNANDRIEGWFTAYPDDATNGGPFIANGLAECKAWADVFLDALKAGLDSRGLPYPARFHMDSEFTFDVGSVYAVMPTSSGYEGWMQFALDDPRATTELIDGVYTFQQHVDNWDPLDSATDLTWSTTNSYWDGVNRNLREFMQHLNLRIRDYIHHEGMMVKAKQLFPGMTWGNWNHGQTGDRTNFGYGRSKADMRLYEDTGPWSDWTSPALYPLRNTTFQGGGSQKENWQTNLGLPTSNNNGPPYEEGYDLIWTTRARQEAEHAVLIAGANTFAPWINHPGETYSISNEYRDDVTLVTIASTDAANFAVGNTISLRDAGDVEQYSGDIVRIVDLEDGNHQINVDNQSPSGSTNYGLVTKALDGTIAVESAVSNVSEESSFFYTTTYSSIESVLEQCVTDGVTEYIFWQGGQINDERWLLVADLVDYVEEGLGVRLGEAVQPVVQPSGSQLTLSFAPPANGPWVGANLLIDPLNEPSVLVNGQPVSFTSPEKGDLSLDGDNLAVTLTFPDRTFLSDDDVQVTLNEGWITDPTPNFRSSATMDVSFGVGANPASSQMGAQNNSQANTGVLTDSTFDFRGRTFLFTFAVPEGQQWDDKGTLTIDTNKEPNIFFDDGSAPAEERWKQDARIVSIDGRFVTVSYQTRFSIAYEQFKGGILSVDIPEGWVSDDLGNQTEEVLNNTPIRENLIVPSVSRTAIQFYGDQGKIIRLSNGAWSGSGFQDQANDNSDGIQIRIRFSYDNTQLPVAFEGLYGAGRGWGYGITSDDEFFFAQRSTRQDGAQPWAVKIPMSEFKADTVGGVDWFEVDLTIETTGIFGGTWTWFDAVTVLDAANNNNDLTSQVIYPASNVTRPFPHHLGLNSPMIFGGIRGDSNWMEGYNDIAPGDIGTGIISSNDDSSVFFARLNGLVAYREFYRNGTLTSRFDFDELVDGEIRDDLYQETGVGISSAPGANFNNTPSDEGQAITLYKTIDDVATWTPTNVVAETRSLGSVRLTWDIPVYAQTVMSYQVDRRIDLGSGFGPWETLTRSVPAYKVRLGNEQIMVETDDREEFYPNFLRDITHHPAGAQIQYRVRGLSFTDFDYDNFPQQISLATSFTESNTVTIPSYNSDWIPDIDMQDLWVPPALQSRIWIWSNPGNKVPSDNPPSYQGFSGVDGNYRDNVLGTEFNTWLEASFGKRINYATSRPFGQNAEEKIGGGSDSAHRLIGRLFQAEGLFDPETESYPGYWQTALSNFLESSDGGELWAGNGTARLDDFVEAHQGLIADGFTMYVYGCPPMANMPLNDPQLIWKSADQLRLFAAAGVGLMFDSLAQTDTVDRFTGDEYLIKVMMDNAQAAGIPVFGEPGGQITYDDPTDNIVGSRWFGYSNYHTIQDPGGTRWSLDVIEGNPDRVHIALVRANAILEDDFMIFYATNGGDENDLPAEWAGWTDEEKLVWLMSNWMANTPKNWHIALLLPFNIRTDFPNLTDEQWETMLDAADITGSPLQPVTPIFPADNAVITERIPARPTFTWTEQPNAKSRFYFGASPTSMRELDGEVFNSNFTLKSDIQSNRTYYWQVRSESPAGHVLSPVFTFQATTVVPTYITREEKRELEKAKKNRPSKRDFVSEIDRLPATVINGFTGSFNESCTPEENEYGTPCWWRGDDAVLNLIDRVEALYNLGWRRVWFNRPMGGAANGIVSSSSWEPLSDKKQEDLQTIFKDYLQARPDLRMGVYVGFALTDDSSSVAGTTASLRSYDFTKKEDIQQIRNNMLPWVDVGISEICCDSAGFGEYRSAYLQYARLLWSRNVICRGEPFPQIESTDSDGNTIVIPDPAYISQTPWMFFEQDINVGGISASSWPSWKVDPTETDVVIALQGRPGSATETDTSEARNYIDEWYANGFNLVAWDNSAWFADYILDRYNV